MHSGLERVVVELGCEGREGGEGGEGLKNRFLCENRGIWVSEWRARRGGHDGEGG